MDSSNKRIAKNTLMLYIRMLLSMFVGLYTSRVVLQTLGVEDYGIYGVVGGVVSMMGFLNASISGATSRYLTFEFGRGDVRRGFSTFLSLWTSIQEQHSMLHTPSMVCDSNEDDDEWMSFHSLDEFERYPEYLIVRSTEPPDPDPRFRN